jgi:serine protease
VLSTFADDSGPGISFGYAFYQGTSMATPHVSGVLALMRSVAPITPAQIDTLLAAGSLTQDLGPPGRDNATGWGLIDARAAVLAAGAPDTAPAALSVTPSGLNFGLVLDELGFVLANTSADPLSVTSISDDAPWLMVTADTVDADGLGTYHASLDRSGLADGTYSATITIVSSAGTQSLPVLMRVGGPTASDAGFHYVLLVDADALVPIAEVEMGAANGAYAYVFQNVPPGNYVVVAGSDLDDDGFICDGGEACGSYPTLDLPAPIALDHDVTNADFGTSFRQTISAGISAARFDRPFRR